MLVERRFIANLVNFPSRIKLLSYFQENSIFTHLTYNEKEKLFSLAKKCEGDTYVEIGSYLGASSCYIAAGIKKSGNGYLYCIDTWKNDGMSEERGFDTFNQFKMNTSKYAELIMPLRDTSQEIAKSFSKKVDFLFIDGDHTYEGVKSDVDNWIPKLNDKATVIFHDIGWSIGVQRVVKESIRPCAKQEGRLRNMYWAFL